MDHFLLFFLFAIAFITMSNLFTLKLNYRTPVHNNTHFIRVPHGVYHLPHEGRRCRDDCTLVEFDGFP